MQAWGRGGAWPCTPRSRPRRSPPTSPPTPSAAGSWACGPAGRRGSSAGSWPAASTPWSSTPPRGPATATGRCGCPSARSRAPSDLLATGAGAAGPVAVLARPDDVARLNFTSGSTGRPRACARSYRTFSLAYRPDRWSPGLTRFVGQGERFLIYGSLAMPVMLTFAGRTLLTGGTVAIAGDDVRDALAPAIAQPPGHPRGHDAPVAPAAARPCCGRPNGWTSPACGGVMVTGSPAGPGPAGRGGGAAGAGRVAGLRPGRVRDDLAAHARRRSVGTAHAALTSVGRVLPEVEVRVDDDGEIWVRSEHVMAGYWDDPAATAEVLRDGWLRTRDVGSDRPGHRAAAPDRPRPRRDPGQRRGLLRRGHRGRAGPPPARRRGLRRRRPRHSHGRGGPRLRRPVRSTPRPIPRSWCASCGRSSRPTTCPARSPWSRDVPVAAGRQAGQARPGRTRRPAPPHLNEPALDLRQRGRCVILMTGELANAICCRSTSLPTRVSEAHGHFVQVVGRRAVRQVQSKSGLSRCRCSAPRHRRRHRPGGPEYRHPTPDGHPVLERSPRLPARTRPGQAGSPPGPTGSHPRRPRSPALRHPQRQHSIREPPRARLLVPEIDVSNARLLVVWTRASKPPPARRRHRSPSVSGWSTGIDVSMVGGVSLRCVLHKGGGHLGENLPRRLSRTSTRGRSSTPRCEAQTPASEAADRVNPRCCAQMSRVRVDDVVHQGDHLDATPLAEIEGLDVAPAGGCRCRPGHGVAPRPGTTPCSEGPPRRSRRRWPGGTTTTTRSGRRPASVGSLP